MIPVFTREQLLRKNKKQILNLLGYSNIRQYYKHADEVGKVSRKSLISLYTTIFKA